MRHELAPVGDPLMVVPIASIINLLSADCAGREKPDSITVGDLAFLKALYSADLEKNLSVEQGDIHFRMSQELLARKTR